MGNHYRYLILVLIAALLWWIPPPPATRVEILDIGQGDAILITTSKGHTMLVDGGPGANVMSELPFDLRLRRRLDLMVATHHDADHIGGLILVLQRFQVKEIWLPHVAPTTQTGLAFDRLAELEGAKLATPGAGEQIDLDDVHVTVLSPLDGEPAEDGEPAHDRCYVIGVSVNGFDVLLTGDAPIKRIQEAYDRWSDFGFDGDLEVLKVGHHGSSTSTNRELVHALRPAAAVISVGAHNRYGHPTAQALFAFSAEQVPVWRTDQSGTFAFIQTNRGPRVGHPPAGLMAWVCTVAAWCPGLTRL